MKVLTLVVLAAGLGSRYGGLKQLEPVGPNGEPLLDYAVFDALRAGFARVVFVIRDDFSVVFKSTIGARYSGRIEVDYVCQDIDDVPAGLAIPADRVRPWGTLHAVLAARQAIGGPFAVINADDFYGHDAYCKVADFLAAADSETAGREHGCMVGYRLEKTLSPHGGVNRGVGRESGKRGAFLAGVEEYKDIRLAADGFCYGFDLAGQRVRIARDATVSMNFWGFGPGILAPFSRNFQEFLTVHGGDADAECYIPGAVDSLIQSGGADCRILKTDEAWFGVTYPQDMPASVEKIRALIAQGMYAKDLWA
ncbi:MAG: NTP transferase domain-containing protein [Propionivibrio sp.]